MSRVIIFALTLFVFTTLVSPPSTMAYTGTVIDSSTKRPVEDAIVTLEDVEVRTDRDGKFQISGHGGAIGLRAYGYQRKSISAGELKDHAGPIELTPILPKALYLSFYGIGSTKLREAALGLIDKTELNAVVVDVKGDRGMIAFKTSLALAEQAHSNQLTTIRDAKALLDRLHHDNIYAIARIVVFKDDPLATARPDLAVKRASGAIFRDRERLAWTDPFNPEVWDYNISIALEAALLGFDEIQFDYVRFPDAPGLKFAKPTDMKSRLAAISGFLAEARRRLTPYNVFLAADIFGYVTWNLDDTHIGQRLEELAPIVDYISPMLYPSCFQFGIPGYRNPVAHPYEIVFLSLQNARERGIPSNRFRPWLQAFRDYAFDRRQFTGTQIRAQVSAAEKFGSDGWMLWNPRNQYTADGLKIEGAPCKHDAPEVIQSAQ
ncbi:MAG: putative glycoside hydrolase [Candidatus Binatus sp.]|uniref:putative glycoside hydrolase n=1 Tax=Candidatus Binatus sp. TaxID=2811406 RepID=UPI0027209AA9|nr:putative glycoside hydrolase [Candidatus Binatus sp.]MDO8431026.1 putative glycoside hydrolase [Candidatus Binatus sp.]